MPLLHCSWPSTSLIWQSLYQYVLRALLEGLIQVFWYLYVVLLLLLCSLVSLESNLKSKTASQDLKMAFLGQTTCFGPTIRFSGHSSIFQSSNLFILVFYFFTLICLSRRLKTTNSSTLNALKLQRRVLVSASLILLCYAVFWAIPFAFSLLGAVGLHTLYFSIPLKFLRSSTTTHRRSPFGRFLADLAML